MKSVITGARMKSVITSARMKSVITGARMKSVITGAKIQPAHIYNETIRYAIFAGSTFVGCQYVPMGARPIALSLSVKIGRTKNPYTVTVTLNIIKIQARAMQNFEFMRMKLERQLLPEYSVSTTDN